MVSVGDVSLSVSLALDELRRDADAARLLLQQQLKDQQIELNLTTGNASSQLQQLSAQILTAKGAVAKDAGEAAAFQRQAALLQELVRYKQQLAAIENSGFSDEEVANAKALAAELNKLNLDRITEQFDELDKEIQQASDRSKTFVGRIEEQARAFQETVSKSSLYTQALNDVSQRLNQAGNAVKAYAAQAAQAALGFDSAKAKVSTLSNDADGLAKRMQELAKELNYQSTSTDLLNASYDVLSSGISDTAEVAEVLRVSTQGALGGFSDVGTVSDAVTTLIAAYKGMGASAKDAQRFVDILAQTQDKGKITIGQYAGQIGEVASTASLAGVSVEELSAIVATATAKGQNASAAISGARQAIVNLLKPTDEAQKYLEKFGVENSAAALRTEGLVGILGKLKAAGATTDDLAKIFSDVTGLATVATLAGQNLGDFKANLDAMGNSAGKAATSADKVANSLQGKLTAATNQANDALVDLGNGVNKAVSPLLDALTFILQNFNKLPAPIKEAVGVALALTGGLLTLAGAVAAVAAVIPVLNAGLALASGAAVAALPAIAALLPVLIALAGAFAAVEAFKYVSTLYDANRAIDDFQKSISASADGAFAAASRTKAAVNALTEAKKAGKALTKDEIKDAQNLVNANQLRLNQLKEELKAVQALPTANKEQENSKAALIATTQKTIGALEKQNNSLMALLPTNAKVATSNKAVAQTVETVSAKYQESATVLDKANKLRQAEIAQSQAQGLITEKQAQQEALDQEESYLAQKLKLAQDNLSDLQALKDATKDPTKLKEINAAILTAESQLADARLAVAQNGIAQRKAAEEKALQEIQDLIDKAEARIADSKNTRTIEVKQQQASGTITDEDAAKRLAAIEQSAITERIAAKKDELAQTRKLKQQGVVDAEESAKAEQRILGEISQLTIEQLDAEISANKAAAEERKKVEADLLKSVQDSARDATDAITLEADNQVLAVKKAQADGLISEQDAAQQTAQIQAQASAETLRIKEDELAQVQALRSSGQLTTEESANTEKQLISDVSQARKAAIEADITLAEAAKQQRIAALEAELQAEQSAAEQRKTYNELDKQALQDRSNLLTAYSDLLTAQTGLMQQRLELQVKEAEKQGDTARAEALKRQILEEQVKAQQQQAAIATEQLRLKQQQTALELQSQRIAAETAVVEAQIAIAKARANGASQVELDNLTRILGLRDQQLAAIDRQASAQSKINQLEQEALKLKQLQTQEALTQQAALVQSAQISSDTGFGGAMPGFSSGGDGSSGGGSSGSGGFGGSADQFSTSITSLTDKLTDLGRVGSLTDAFNTANLSLGLKTGFTSPVQVSESLGGGDVLGKLDQLIATTKDSANRPNLSISNINDLGMAGKIYGDISRDSFRSAAL